MYVYFRSLYFLPAPAWASLDGILPATMFVQVRRNMKYSDSYMNILLVNIYLIKDNEWAFICLEYMDIASSGHNDPSQYTITKRRSAVFIPSFLKND